MFSNQQSSYKSSTAPLQQTSTTTHLFGTSSTTPQLQANSNFAALFGQGAAGAAAIAAAAPATISRSTTASSEVKISEATESEATETEAKKIEAKKSEATETEAKKIEAKRSEATETEAKKIEAKKSEATETEAKKIEAKRSEVSLLVPDEVKHSSPKAGSTRGKAVPTVALGSILKEVPQFWLPVSLKENPLVLKPRLETIFSIIQRFDVDGDKASALSYFQYLLDVESHQAYEMRFNGLCQSSDNAQLDSDKVVVALLKVCCYKPYDAYEQFMNPTVRGKEDIKTALERLYKLTLVYAVSDPVTAVARLLRLLLSKPEFFSGLISFQGSDDYVGLVKKAIWVCNYYLDSGITLPRFNRVSNRSSIKAGQLSLGCSFCKRKSNEKSECSKRISNSCKVEVGDNVISERKLKFLIKDGVALDEAIVLARISSARDRLLNSTFPNDPQPNDSDVPLNAPELKSKADEQQKQQTQQQQQPLLSDLLPSHWLPIDRPANSEAVSEHQLKAVFQTIATLLPPNAPITTHIEMLRTVMTDEFSMLLHNGLLKELPTLKGPKFPSTSEVIDAIMHLSTVDEAVALVQLRYPRPEKGESTVDFLWRLRALDEIFGVDDSCAAARNLVCLLVSNCSHFSSLLGVEELHHDYPLLLEKAIEIAEFCADGGYPITLGTDDKWSGREIKSEDEKKSGTEIEEETWMEHEDMWSPSTDSYTKWKLSKE